MATLNTLEFITDERVGDATIQDLQHVVHSILESLSDEEIGRLAEVAITHPRELRNGLNLAVKRTELKRYKNEKVGYEESPGIRKLLGQKYLGGRPPRSTRR